MLFPRQRIIQKMNKKQKLLLPGVHQRVDSFPAFHIYLQQKYHQFNRMISNTHNSSIEGGNNQQYPNVLTSIDTENENDTPLSYFDIVTMWVAPMEFDVDEEAFLRMMRYAQDVRSSLQQAGRYNMWMCVCVCVFLCV